MIKKGFVIMLSAALVLGGTTNFSNQSYVQAKSVENKQTVTYAVNTLTTKPKDITAPAIPVNLSAQPSDKAVTITWTANTESDLRGYQLEYKLSTAKNWSVASSSLSSAATAFTKKGLINGSVYQFRLKAKDISGNWSGYTEIISSIPRDSVAPPVPTKLSVSSVNDKQVALVWNSVSSSDLSGYQIEYKEASVNTWAEIEVGKVKAYIVTGLENEKEYYFRIKAKDTSSNLSEPSAEIAAIPEDRMAPAAPTGLVVSAGSNKDVTLTWNANKEGDLAGYEVAYGKTGASTLTAVPVDASVNYLHIEGLVQNAKYTFKVMAKDQLGNRSIYSSTVTVKPVDKVAPSIPANLSVQPNDRAITVNWSSNSEQDLGGYQLEYKLSTAKTWSIASKSLGAKTTTYKKTGLINGSAYQFRMKAKDTSGNWSDYTEIITGIPFVDTSVVTVTSMTGLQAAIANISTKTIIINTNITIPKNEIITIPSNKSIVVNSKVTLQGTIKTENSVLRSMSLNTESSDEPNLKIGADGRIEVKEGSSMEFNSFADIITPQQDSVILYAGARVSVGGKQYIGDRDSNAVIKLSNFNGSTKPAAGFFLNGDKELLLVIFERAEVLKTEDGALDMGLLVKAGGRYSEPGELIIPDFNVLKSNMGRIVIEANGNFVVNGKSIMSADDTESVFNATGGDLDNRRGILFSRYNNDLYAVIHGDVSMNKAFSSAIIQPEYFEYREFYGTDLSPTLDIKFDPISGDFIGDSWYSTPSMGKYGQDVNGRWISIASTEQTIVNIPNISRIVNLKENFVLPKMVTATMSDGTVKSVAVAWDNPSADTSSAGTFIYTGTVNGYSGNVRLTLKVINPGGFEIVYPISDGYVYYFRGININFNRDITVPTDWSKIKITDSIGEEMPIDSVNTTISTKELQIYSSKLANGSYTISIPANTICDTNGNKYDKDILIKFQVKLQ